MAKLNRNLQQLFDTAQKDEKLAIGLMSGTSLDGLDIALCKFRDSGPKTKFSLINFVTIPYSDNFKAEVQQVFARRDADLEKVCLLNEYIGDYHAQLVLQALEGWSIERSSVDFIASHGQTIYHAPQSQHKQPGYPDATLQIGDGDHIAVKTGILTISDFRQKHVAAGGEGAPLALYGDVLLGSKPGENRILLNIGGIANLTYLPANGDFAKVICTDIGPGNTLIDAACRKYFDKPYDEGSNIAHTGKVNDGLLAALFDNPFFKEKLPKTTGPELFSLNYIQNAQKRMGVTAIAPEDLLATLSSFTAKNIADFITSHFQVEGLKIFASGGGVRNPYVMESLRQALPGAELAATSTLGIDPDAKEAILFALLGNEALCGEPFNIGDSPAILMGKFSFPG